jgi:hypothetical protein
MADPFQDRWVDEFLNSPKNEVGVVEHKQLLVDNVNAVASWCNGVIVEEIDPFTDERFAALNVQCGDDVKRVSVGGTVVKKEDGTFDVR